MVCSCCKGWRTRAGHIPNLGQGDKREEQKKQQFRNSYARSVAPTDSHWTYCVSTGPNNKGAYELCHKYTSAQHTRHIDRKLFKLREMRGAGVVKV